MSKPKEQSLLFRGIYEFDDPSGTLIAAKVPAVGSADLYDGTVVLVRPQQCALFIHQGQIADVLLAGSHTLKTENVPILTRLANWKLGVQSPLRSELIFIAGHIMTGRRWGSPQPTLVSMKELGAVPIRSFGNFSVAVCEPKSFYSKLMGTRTALTLSDLEDFVQGQIIEILPEVFAEISSLETLAASYSTLSKKLEKRVNEQLRPFGLMIPSLQILSALPSKEVVQAMDAKTAIQLIGSQREYLLYKAANSLTASNDGTANDPMQMMMGLMLGRGLLGSDYHEKEVQASLESKTDCPVCRGKVSADARFCSQCGGKLR